MMAGLAHRIARYLPALAVLVVAAVVAASIWSYAQENGKVARNPDTAGDLAALRLQATDLQRMIETLARSAAPDQAELAALAQRLDLLNRRFAAITGDAERN